MNYNYYKYNMSNKFDIYSDLNELEMLLAFYIQRQLFLLYTYFYFIFLKNYFLINQKP